MDAESKKQSHEVTVEDILAQLKPFGKFNVISYALILFPVFLTGIYASVYNFEAMDLVYRCAVPECDSEGEFSESLNFTIPHNGESFEKCVRYAPRWNSTYDEGEGVGNATCEPQHFDPSLQVSCESFVYQEHEDHSIVKEFDLGCQDWKRTLIGTIHNAGFFISIPLTGIISDRYGRRFALTAACLMNGVFGVIRALSTSYSMFAVFEFLEPAFGGGCYTACFVLAMELVGPKGRVFVSLLINLCFIAGGVTVTLLSWWLQNWRHLLFALYTPAIFIVVYLWILNESFRWLFSKGRNEEAIEVLKKAAKMNNVTITQEQYDSIDKQALEQRDLRKTETSISNCSPFKEIFTSCMIWKRASVCSFLWITCTLVYYGLSINAITLSGNSYVNYIVVIIIEAPANVTKLFVLDRYGRKRVISIAFFLSGIILINYAFIPDGIWPLIFFLGGKFFITLAYNSLYVFAAEVFPTSFRTTLLAVVSTIGRIGSVVAPQTPLMANIYEFLPTTLFGAMAVVSCLLVLTLPETNNQKLPDTLKEAHNLDKKSDNNNLDKKNKIFNTKL